MSTTKKPSHEESEYFARQEIENRRNLTEKLRAQMHAAEVDKLRQLHWRHCPNCGFEMYDVVFRGVTIEKCPNCGGIFLQAGEVGSLVGKEGSFISSVLGLFKF
jgi:hypothetical protein